MKKLIFFTIMVLICVRAGAQSKPGGNMRDSMRTAINLKSGNEQDVLSSFFQLAFNDLQSPQHSFQFQSSILAWESRFNPNIYEDTYYKKNRFARNFVFGLGVGTDSTNKLRNKNLSFKYAIINNRDSFLFSTNRLPFEKEWSRISEDAFTEYLNMYHHKVTNDNVKKAHDFVYYGKEKRTSVNELPDDFKAILKRKLDSSANFKGMPLEDYQVFEQKAYERFVAQQRKRALLTVGANINFDPAYNLNAEYLKGITNPLNTVNIDLDIRADYYDSVNAVTKSSRQLLQGSAGLNFIFNGSDNMPYVEFKLAVADSYISEGRKENEARNTFYLDGTFRLRLINNIWLPVEFKYDPKNGNFAGLLNVRFNLNN